MDTIPFKEIALVGASLISLFGIKMLMDRSYPEQQPQVPSNKPTSVAGITNYGNTCFINSLMQALASVKTFEYNIKQLVINQSKKQTADSVLLQQLLCAIKSINQGEGVIEIDGFLNALFVVAKEICNFEQQDAHQFYKILVNSLENAYKSALQRTLSNSFIKNQQIENSLLGFTQSCLECLTCKNKLKIKLQCFYDLSLEINSPTIGSLQKALQNFQRYEYLEGVNCVYCSMESFLKRKTLLMQKLKGKQQTHQVLADSCSQLISFAKGLSIIDKQIEQINPLINGFIDQQYEQLAPVMSLIQKDPHSKDILEQFFREVVQVKSGMCRRTRITKYPKILVIHLKRLVMDSWSGDIVLLQKYISYPLEIEFTLRSNKIKTYALTSLLSHTGSASMGHYYAFRKHQQTWYFASDKNVERCTQLHALRQNAYMLFYENICNDQ